MTRSACAIAAALIAAAPANAAMSAHYATVADAATHAALAGEPIVAPAHTAPRWSIARLRITVGNEPQPTRTDAPDQSTLALDADQPLTLSDALHPNVVLTDRITLDNDAITNSPLTSASNAAHASAATAAETRAMATTADGI